MTTVSMRPRRMCRLTDMVTRWIDNWSAADRPINAATLRDKKQTYAIVFVLVLVMSLCVVVASAGDGDLWVSMAGVWFIFLSVVAFIFKWKQLKRIPIDAQAAPPLRPQSKAQNTVNVADAIVAVVGGLAAIVVGLASIVVAVIAALLSLAITAFIFLGIAGLLLFGIRQIF